MLFVVAVVRNVGIGTASMIARIGSMVAPFVLSLKELSPVYPAIILGIMPLVGAVLVLFLPETQGFVQLSILLFFQFLCTKTKNFHFFYTFQFNLDIHCRQQLKMLKILEGNPRNNTIKHTKQKNL